MKSHKTVNKRGKGGATMEWEVVICTIIANAGESKSCSLAAIEAAREGDFEEADRMLQESERTFLLAHEAHVQILTKEAGEEAVPMSFLLVHAANHLSNAEIAKDMAEQLVAILRKGMKIC